MQIQKYQSKLSGPLLDRIDIKVSVQAVSYQDATVQKTADFTSSKTLREGVQKAIIAQKERFGLASKSNSMMTAQEVEQFCKLSDAAEQIMQKAFSRLNLSMRSYHKILKLARTIADIDGSESIDQAHIQEAIMYKS
jgi:magnesium chelatase family protein